MHTPQVSLRSDLSWGQAPDFQSVMIIYPNLGYGAEVLTNSDLLNPDVAIAITRRAALNLELNYQGSFLEE